jgi:anthranilate synthase component 2
MRILLIDNYDSFTYNLVHLIRDVSQTEVTVWKNDAFSMDEVASFDHIILSPGPGVPEEAGLLKSVIQTYKSHKKIFGVCLGLQAIGEVYGAQLKNLSKVYHGMKTPMHKTSISDPILQGIESPFDAGRYHSWVIDRTTCPEDLLVTATDDNGEIMAARHKSDHVYGVQFHPESIMTPDGHVMMKNFLKL